MTNQVIPEEAVEAAARAMFPDNVGPAYNLALRALEAAAPHMLAVILDDAAEPSGGGKAMEIQISAPTRITEQNELALVIAAAEGWERQDLTTDALEDYLQTAAEVLAAGFRKTHQVIPEAAVEAAARLIATEVWRTPHTGDIAPDHLARLTLEAAAPHMLREAQEFAWDKGAASAGMNLPALRAAGINPNPYRAAQ